jgi:hypothetical protein
MKFIAVAVLFWVGTINAVVAGAQMAKNKKCDAMFVFLSLLAFAVGGAGFYEAMKALIQEAR